MEKSYFPSSINKKDMNGSSSLEYYHDKNAYGAILVTTEKFSKIELRFITTTGYIIGPKFQKVEIFKDVVNGEKVFEISGREYYASQESQKPCPVTNIVGPNKRYEWTIYINLNSYIDPGEYLIFVYGNHKEETLLVESV